MFPLIETMFSQGLLPEGLNLWRVYYLLALDSDKYYPDEFMLDDAQDAVDWAHNRGVQHDTLLEWYAEYVRRKSPVLFQLPAVIEYQGQEETLDIPIMGTRDFGSFRDVLLGSFRLAHPDTPADLPYSEISVKSLPSINLTLQYGRKKKDITLHPFDAEREHTRVAALAFGEGVKDNDTTLIKWHIIPPAPPLSAAPFPEPLPIPAATADPASADGNIPQITPAVPPSDASPKSPVAAAILCLFLGWLGIHRFYLGKIITGILYLLSFGLMGFGVALDSILMLGAWAKDGKRRKLRTSNAAKIISIPGLLLYSLFFMVFIIGQHQAKKPTPPPAPQEGAPAATTPESPTAAPAEWPTPAAQPISEQPTASRQITAFIAQ